MRKQLITLLTVMVLAMPGYAQQVSPQSLAASREATLTHSEPDEQDLQEHRHYRNKHGEVVHAPSASKSGKVPEGASAQCRDGTYSFSHSRRGTCSHHGGVAAWL